MMMLVMLIHCPGVAADGQHHGKKLKQQNLNELFKVQVAKQDEVELTCDLFLSWQANGQWLSMEPFYNKCFGVACNTQSNNGDMH